MRHTISANIIVRNEIRFIEGLVKNLIDAKFDEIIFLDGGSTDGTQEVIESYRKKYSHIHLIVWQQRDGAEYSAEFREVDRRNLLIHVSRCDYIFSIDADERIGFGCDTLNIQGDLVFVPLIQYWGNYNQIRLSTADDNKWSTSYRLRLFKNDKTIFFNSRDPNGLHNHLEKNGKKIKYHPNDIWRKRIWKQIKLRLRNIKLQTLSVDYLVHHLHYANLTHKCNDLRSNDIQNCRLVLVNSEYEALKHSLSEERIVCVKNVGRQYYSQIENYI